MIAHPMCKPPPRVITSPRAPPPRKRAVCLMAFSLFVAATTSLAISRAPASFQAALGTAPALCTALQGGGSPSALTDFLQSSAGARGFFVTWLTGDEWTRADDAEPPAALTAAVIQAPDEVAELMLMNVVMSAATGRTLQIAGRDDEAELAGRTCARAIGLVRSLADRMPTVQSGLDQLLQLMSVTTEKELASQEDDASGAGDDGDVDEARWVDFLSRWQYDDEQCEAVRIALLRCAGGADTVEVAEAPAAAEPPPAPQVSGM